MIDGAQKNITDLASQVTSLHEVLANKQARGAFGQGRMEAIVQDGLPKGAYEFQFTLSNGKRPDCAMLPARQAAAGHRRQVSARRRSRRFATRKSDDERKMAAQRLRQDVDKHFADIAEKYLIPGETQDMALMFVPSESVYAELHDGFDDVVQKAYRARVVMVSPSLLMLAIQVIQQIQKDARMREAADQIRDEVGHLMERHRPARRPRPKLQTHFNQSNEDIRQTIFDREDRDARRAHPRQVEFGATRRRRATIIRAAAQARRRANSGMAVDAGAEPAKARLARRAHGLSQAARADRAVSRLLGGPAAGAVRLDPAVWMRQSGIDLDTIGLFALVGTPYTIKFLWAPVVDALDVPLLTRWLGRRRGWLVFSQIVMIAAIVCWALCDPARLAWPVVFAAALFVATAAATQDILIDAYRIESLPESEQAAGMASYVAAYRIGTLVSTAGMLFIVSGLRDLQFDLGSAWMLGYFAMAAIAVDRRRDRADRARTGAVGRRRGRARRACRR